MKFDKDGNPIKDAQGDDDDIIIEDDDDSSGKDGEIEIDVDDDDDDGSGVPKEEKARNTAFATMRIENKELKTSVEKLTQQVAELTRRPAQPVQPAQAPATTPVPAGMPQTEEEWDDLADKDWKKAVDLRSIQNAKNIIQQQQQVAKADRVLTESKQKVLAVHPELSDNNSEKSKIYLSILDANPDYLTQPRGPIYAMRDMEDYMENTLGYKRSEIRSAERAGATREASRQNRIVLNKGSGRVNANNGNKITLTKDEMEFCKFQGIDPKEYARNKKMLSKSGKKDEVTI